MGDNIKKKLKEAYSILESDNAFEADSITCDRFATKRERRLAEVIHQLYGLIHPIFCPVCHKN